MITLQNIGTTTQTLIVNQTYISVVRNVDPNRFVHLSDSEYNFVTENGSKPLTGLDTENNTSHIWKWIAPLDAFGNPIVPEPEVEPPVPPYPLPTPPAASREGIEDEINDGVTNLAPSENAVYDALAKKAEWLGGSVRPLNPILYQMWFDTTLQRPIWWSGSAWIDLFAHAETTHEGSLTVSGSGEAQIPISDQPSSVIVEFSDPTPPPSGCGSSDEDVVDYVIEYIPTPSPVYILRIIWDIHSGDTRQIAWQATY